MGLSVLIIGSGGREHALAVQCAKSDLVDVVDAAPGNGGTSLVGTNHDVSISNIDGIVELVEKKRYGLTIVGPEAPLCAGLVDKLEARGHVAFGPRAAVAKLEGSKIFAKKLMVECGVPTAAHVPFFADEQGSGARLAHEYVARHSDKQFVVKADGLCGGKGVVVTSTPEEAHAAVDDMMVKRVFGAAGSSIVLEERLEGEELSVMCLVDGINVVALATAQDFKREFDDDQGRNTGGMGSYSSVRGISDAEVDEIVRTCIMPIIVMLARRGTPYRGVIYAGLMRTKKGWFVLEYNVRFGDPEVQAMLVRLESDIVPYLLSAASGNMAMLPQLEWSTDYAVNIVVVSGPYPGEVAIGLPITGLGSACGDPDVDLFHAGTRATNGGFVTTGGRVANVVARAKRVGHARVKAMLAAKKIEFATARFRNDIAWKAAQQEANDHRA